MNDDKNIVAWVLIRDDDPTFPRAFSTEAAADRMLERVTVHPAPRKIAVYDPAKRKRSQEDKIIDIIASVIDTLRRDIEYDDLEEARRRFKSLDREFSRNFLQQNA